jgi:hypothetical protein
MTKMPPPPPRVDRNAMESPSGENAGSELTDG